MKIFIEVNGGTICNIVSTEDCKIYLVDHDNLKERGGTKDECLRFFSPAIVTGEMDSDDNDTTSDFDNLLAGALAEYEPEEGA